MSEVIETALPGVGLRYDFVSEAGQRIGVVHHRTGRRELFVCPADDPDAVQMLIDLSEDDSRTLAELLGISKIAEHLEDLQQRVEGLALDWLPIDGASPYAGRTIGDARIRTRTGVSVVAVLRGETPHPAPGPGFQLQSGDTIVVVGTPEGIETVTEVLRSG